MRPYIKLNTDLRTQAKNEFKKDFHKLMVCSCFGKTMENVRNHIRVDLVRPEGESDKLRRMIADPAFIERRIFDGNLVAVHRAKGKVRLNKPIYLGAAILDLSKLLMYEFYYEHLQKRYGDKMKLVYTDTDSLILEIETEDIYKDMSENAELYDFSDYPTTHPLHSNANKKVVGKFKDESCGRIITEVVALRPKMYSIVEASGKETKKAKGVSRQIINGTAECIIKEELSFNHELYLNSLKNKKEERHPMVGLRSTKHRINLLEVNKISLSPLDTKKWIEPDGITTRAYGHYLIENSLGR